MRLWGFVKLSLSAQTAAGGQLGPVSRDSCWLEPGCPSPTRLPTLFYLGQKNDRYCGRTLMSAIGLERWSQHKPAGGHAPYCPPRVPGVCKAGKGQPGWEARAPGKFAGRI